MHGKARLTPLSLIAAIALLGAAVSPTVAAAEGPTSPEHLVRAEAAWTSQEYEVVIREAEAVLASPRATPGQRVLALRWKASSLAVLGNDADSAAAFTQLLELDPTHELPEQTSPRILAVFRPARSRWALERETELRERLGADLSAVALQVEWPRAARGGRSIAIPITLRDRKKLVAEVLIYYRRAGQRSYSAVRARPKALSFSVEIPAALTASAANYRLEAFATAVHDSGITLRRSGTRDKPLSLAVGAGLVPGPKPVYKRWWFWAGAAALGIAVPLLVDQAIDVGPQRVRGSLER